jgi:hypothetical protein
MNGDRIDCKIIPAQKHKYQDTLWRPAGLIRTRKMIYKMQWNHNLLLYVHRYVYRIVNEKGQRTKERRG